MFTIDEHIAYLPWHLSAQRVSKVLISLKMYKNAREKIWNIDKSLGKHEYINIYQGKKEFFTLYGNNCAGFSY